MNNLALKQYLQKGENFVFALPLDLPEAEIRYKKWGGNQAAKEGDWLVKNGDETYTVDRESFDQTYQKIDNLTYRKNAPVWAEVAQTDGKITTKEGFTHYRAGDYLVYNNADRTDGYALTKQDFDDAYVETNPRMNE